MDHYKDIEEIPMIFGPRELSKILGISKNKTYEVVNRYDFPKIRVGRRIIISKKHFLEWMDIKVLSALLGHAQASTTLNLYGHVLPDHKKISMEKMRGNYMSCSSISGSSDDTSADVPQTQDPIISTIEDAQHNQEPAISIAAEDIQGLELSGDTNTAMPQIHDSTADTNANEEQAQAS